MTGHSLRWIAFFTLVLTILVTGYGFFGPLPRADAQALTPDQRAALQSQYDALQAEIAQWQKVLDDTKAQKSSLQGDVTALNAQIAKAQAEIKQRSLTIASLGDEINQKTQTIASLQDQLTQGQESLAKLIRQKNETETQSLVLLALSSQGLSDFLADVDDIDSINRSLGTLFDQLRSIQASTTAARDALNQQQNAQKDAEHDVEVKKAAITDDQTQKKQLLAVTTQNEQTYTQVLADRQAKAAAIRAALFQLRDAAAIQFGDALTYAQAAQKTTGVDPALVLAILTQESNLGANVGQCYLTNDQTGAGVGKNTGTAFAKVMSPTRDVPPFLALASKLGFDPHKQVVSCPIGGVGYGGAMGPAQFIASTWSGLATQIASARGISVADPWNPQDAIMAMSIFLGQLGAGGGSYTAEKTAAAKYYAGGNWATLGQTYATQVMAKVDDIQKNISFLTDNGL